MTSTRRALLISSPRNGLEATGPSLARMRELLARQGFAIADAHCLHGERATRAAIIAALGALIEATGPDDVVVLYYAGHGGLFRDSVGARVEPHPVLEPIDLADSDASHFNGLLGSELRLFTRALARLCDNVTAIFDCCHAAGLVATDQPAADTDDAADRAAIAAVARRAGERLARLRNQQGLAPTRSPRGPAPGGIVRLVASSASERAYAHPTRPILLFTDTLVSVLEEYALAGRLTWEQIIRHVRARVQELRPEQRPGVEGARERRPFTTDLAPTPIDHVHVQRHGQQLRVALGAAAGIRPDDVFELLPYTGDGPPLGVARPVLIRPFHAVLERPRGLAAPPHALFGRRVRKGPPALAARLSSSDRPDDRAAVAALSAALRDFQLQDPVVGDTPPGHVDLLDVLNPDDDRDFKPQLVARLPLADPDTFDALARALRRLERWAGLAAQLGHPGQGPIAGCYDLEWGHDAGDDIRPLARDGRVRAGETLTVRVTNPGRLGALHFQVFRVRADRCVDPWRDVDGGLGVLTRHRVPLRERFLPLPELPGRQREWLVVALGDGPFELSQLATPATSRPGARGADDATRVEILGIPYILADAP